MATWGELQQEFYNALNQIEGILDRTIKICDHFEGMMKEMESLRSEENFIISETQKNLSILDKLTDVDDKENIPPSVMFRSAEIFLRAQYIVTVLLKVNTFISAAEVTEKKQESTKSEPFTPIPKGMLH